MKHSVGRRTLPITLLAAAMVVVQGCSSSGSVSTQSPRVASSTAAGGSGSGSSSGSTPAPAPLKIGEICSCSGPFGAQNTNGEKTVQAWVNATNASGGVNGHPVELSFHDDGGNPGTSVSAAQALISSHVAAIMNLSQVDSAWASAVSAAGIPVVGGSFGDELFFTNPDFYPAGQTNDSLVYSLAATAKLAGATNLGVLYCAEAPQCQQTIPLLNSAGKQVGLPVNYSASISATAPNYTAQCVAAQQAHISSVFIADVASIFYKIGQDCTQQGYKPIYLGEGQQYTTEEGTTPGMDEDLWLPFTNLPFFDHTSPAIRKMDAALDKYYPGLREDSDVYNELPVQTWSGLVMIATALNNSKADQDISAADVTAGLDSFKNETLGGLTAPLTFTKGKPHSVACWYTVRVQGGKAHLVNNGKLSCQEK